jgi:Zn-finger nucleic acid-binding protein
VKCPVDGADLAMTDRNGIEIDYCPKCRGVWLDRGELDKILERADADPAPRHAAPAAAAQPHQPPPREYYDNDRRYRDDDDDRRGYGHGYGHKKRRKSFLGEIFDFD